MSASETYHLGTSPYSSKIFYMPSPTDTIGHIYTRASHGPLVSRDWISAMPTFPGITTAQRLAHDALQTSACVPVNGVGAVFDRPQ